MSDYKPYRSFEEWSVGHAKAHRPKFFERAMSILERLRKHSEDHPGKRFKADRIAASLGVSRTQVNNSINYLRGEGYPICSDADGYWYSEVKDDVQQTINHLQDRIYAMHYSISKLKRYI